MRAILIASSVLFIPWFALASVPDPFIYDAYLIAMPKIPNFTDVQTALKAGDRPTLQVLVHSNFVIPPSVSADLADFGLSHSATTSGNWAGYAALYPQAYFYNFGPLSASSTPDGLYKIPITATNAIGSTTSITTSIRVDNAPPTVSLTRISFSAIPPQQGDYIYLSGTADGTGSAAKVSGIMMSLLDASGGPVISPITGGSSFAYSGKNINAAIATSTDGSFSNIPFLLYEFNDIGWIARAATIKVFISIYDEAGNTASTTLTVPVPKSAPPDPCANGGCVSNVLFLPGIEASRLYYRGALGIEHQVWEPDYRTDIPYLALNGDGTSKYPLYTKDIVDTIQAHNPLIGTIADMFGSNLETYGGFMRFMDVLVASSTVKEWKAYPYDWRYDVRDIVENGTPTETSDGSIKRVYVTDMLRAMASSSPTKKVTIVAHSNGGLLAKALAIRLGADAPKYIDRIVMIGTPQWGTPSDIGVMLHGDGQTNGLGLITTSGDVRAAAETMPSIYGLLPSPAYFAHLADPVVTFDRTGLLSGKYAASFGEALTSFPALANFLTDAAGLNAQAGSSSDLRTPLALSSALVNKATATHGVLDTWTPPPGITVTSIAGWGQDTVKTLAYTTKQRISCNTSISTILCTETPYLEHAPVTTQDGDGTVVSPSVVGNIGQKLYFDSFLFEKDKKIKIIHQNLTSSAPLQKVLLDLFTQKDPTGEPYTSASSPSNGTNPINLRISSHSPVNVVITDANGNQSGVLPIPGTDFFGVKRDIPGSSVQVFDDEEYVSVPADGAYQVLASGYAAGSATIDVETISGDIASTTATFSSVPTTVNSTLAFSVTSGAPTAPAVDVNGDGTMDFSVVSSSVGSDPLSYVRYMRGAIGAFSLPKNKNQLDQKLAEIERQLASMKKGGAKSNPSLLATLAHYVEQQITLKNPEKGIPVAQAEIILDMISTLKTLLI